MQNKHTEEKLGPEKIILQYLIRIIQKGSLDKKNNRTCTIIPYPRVYINLHLTVFDSNSTVSNTQYFNGKLLVGLRGH